MTPVLYIATALLCFEAECVPVLIGDNTPRGVYALRLEHRTDIKYGPLLVFHEDDKHVWAFHLPPSPQRVELLKRGSRKPVTLGCVNVDESTFNRLLEHSHVAIQ